MVLRVFIIFNMVQWIQSLSYEILGRLCTSVQTNFCVSVSNNHFMESTNTQCLWHHLVNYWDTVHTWMCQKWQYIGISVYQRNFQSINIIYQCVWIPFKWTYDGMSHLNVIRFMFESIGICRVYFYFCCRAEMIKILKLNYLNFNCNSVVGNPF